MKEKELNILLVEDNPGDIFLMEELLHENKSVDFRITQAETLAEATKRMTAGNFDIILLDLGLPDSKGLQTLEVILKKEYDIPVLVITGLDDDQTGQKAVSLGAQGYFVKGELNSRLITQSILYSIERFESLKKLRKRENELKIKNSLLKEVSSTKDLLISIISHDLRGPVSSVISLLDVINTEFDNISDKNKKNYIQSILASAQNTQRLMENLLEWAKTQTNRHIFKEEKIFIRAVIEKSMENISLEAQKKEIEINDNTPPDLYACADRDMIMTVVRNLLSNAVKFTPRYGTINIGAQNNSDSDIMICIDDTGVGIKKESLEKLFDIGKSVSTPGTENEPGTGFGLGLCREFIEKNKGKLWIDCTSEKGTTICFTLPRCIQKSDTN